MQLRIPKDYFSNPITPPVFLCTQSGTQMGELQVSNTSLNAKWNAYSTFNFDANRTYVDVITGETKIHPLFDRIEGPRTVLVDGYGYFVIQDDDTIYSDNDSKSISAFSIDYNLSSRFVNSFHVNTGEVDSFEVMYELDKYGSGYNPKNLYELASGAFDPHRRYYIQVPNADPDLSPTYEGIQIIDKDAYNSHFGNGIESHVALYVKTYENVKFYDMTTQELSLLHIILKDIPDWKIGHVDDALKNKERKISEDRIDIYSLFTTKLADIFECVFEFDTLTKTINVYAEEEDGLTDDGVTDSKYDTDIYISRANLASEVQISTSTDNIKTRLKVGGSEDLDIREVNLGKNYIMNLDYYHSHKTDEKGNKIPDYEWMEQDLFEQYSKYEDAVEEYSPKYTEAMQNWVKAYNAWDKLMNDVPVEDGVLMIGDEFKKLYCTYTPTDTAYINQQIYDSYINQQEFDTLYIDPKFTIPINKNTLDNGQAFVVQGYHFEYVNDVENKKQYYKCIRNITTTTALQSLYKKLNLYHVDEDTKANKTDNILLRLQNTEKDIATIRVYCKYVKIEDGDLWNKDAQYYVLKENKKDEYAKVSFNKNTDWNARPSELFTNVYWVKTDITRATLSATEASQEAPLSAWIQGKLIVDSDSDHNLSNLKGFKVTHIGTLGAYLCLAKQEIQPASFTYNEDYLFYKNLVAEYAAEYNSLVNGNVDYAKRPIISAEKMQKVWPEFDGEFATTYSQGYSIGKGDNFYTIELTPICEDGTILSQEGLDKYHLTLLTDNGMDGVLASDKSNLIIHIQKGEYNQEYWDKLQNQLGVIKDKHLEAALKLQEFDEGLYEPTPYLKSFGVRLLQEKQDTYMTIFQTQTEGMFSQEKYQCIVSDAPPAGNFDPGTRWIDSDSSPVKLYIYNDGWQVASGVGINTEDQASYENYQRYIDNFNKLQAVQEVLTDKQREAQYWLDGYAVSNRIIDLENYKVKYILATDYDKDQTYYDKDGNELNPQPTSQTEIDDGNAYLEFKPNQSLEGDMQRVAIEHFGVDKELIARVSLDTNLPLYTFTTSFDADGKFYTSKPTGGYSKGDKWITGADYAPNGMEVKYIPTKYYIDGEIYYDANHEKANPQPASQLEVQEGDYYVIIHYLLEAKATRTAGNYSDDDWGEITTYAVYLKGQTPYVAYSNSRGVYQAWMDYYSDLTALESFFNEDQWIRLSPLIRDDEFTDDNFLLNGLESEEERLEICRELMAAAAKELKTLSQPSLEFSMDMANILALKEFEPIVDQFALGNFIRIEFRDGLVKKSRLLEVNLSFNDLSDFSCTFGNLVSGKSEIDLHAELLSQAISAGKQVATSSGEWQKAVDKSSKLEEDIRNGLTDAALKIGRASGQAISWDHTGMHFRKYKDGSTTEYEPEEMAIINNSLVATDDGWKTSKAAFGKYTIRGEERWGPIAEYVTADTIEGKFITGGSIEIGEGDTKFIVNSDGSVEIKSGGTNYVNAIKEIDDAYRYQTILTYDKSTVFSDSTDMCTVTCSVYDRNTNITQKLIDNGATFSWIRSSYNGQGDVDWNNSHVNQPSNVITITPKDVMRNSTFSCEVTFDEKILESITEAN